MTNPYRHRSYGFTLIEVLVAMLVAGLGIGALLTTLTSAADTTGRLRDKSLASWIALNQIATLRLSGTAPQVGITRDSVDYAGRKWSWEQEISDPGVAGILRVDVRVAPLPAGVTQAPQQPTDKPMAGIGTAFGYLSSSVMRPNGMDPDWSFPVQRSGGGGRGGGGAGGGGATQFPQP